MATTIASLPTFLVRHKEKLGIAVEDGIVETFRRVKGKILTRDFLETVVV